MPVDEEDTILKEIKPTLKGAIVVLILLIVFPLLIDSVFLFSNIPKLKNRDSMSTILAGHYLKLLPFFIGYLIVAILCIRFFKKRKIKL